MYHIDIYQNLLRMSPFRKLESWASTLFIRRHLIDSIVSMNFLIDIILLENFLLSLSSMVLKFQDDRSKFIAFFEPNLRNLNHKLFLFGHRVGLGFPSVKHILRLVTIVLFQTVEKFLIACKFHFVVAFKIEDIVYFSFEIIFDWVKEVVSKSVEYLLVDLFTLMDFDDFFHIDRGWVIGLEMTFSQSFFTDRFIFFLFLVINEQHFIFIKFILDKHNDTTFCSLEMPFNKKSKSSLI